MIDERFNLLLFSIPFWIPAAVGLYLVAHRRNEFSLMAGLLTLKPILTTPLWLMIISFLDRQAVAGALIAPCSILPGASLTILALAIFRPLFFGPRSASARMLIVLDCMRWINSGLLTGADSLVYTDIGGPLACISGLIGLFFPSAYAVVALTTTLAAPGD